MIYIRLTFSQKPAVPASESVSEKSSFFFSVLLIFSNSCPGLVGSGLLGGFTDRYCSRLSREDISGDVEGMVSSGRRTAAASKGIVSVLSKDFEASFVSFSPANTINSEQVLKNTWKISGDTTKIKSHNHTVIAILYRTWMHIKKNVCIPAADSMGTVTADVGCAGDEFRAFASNNLRKTFLYFPS